MVQAKGLSRSYGRIRAVSSLDFDIQKGEVLGFLGPNGAGKSTTMNMLTGYLAPGAGSIQIGPHDLLEEPEKARKLIGYLPEQPPLYDELTVNEYLKFTAAFKKLPKTERGPEVSRVSGLVKLEGMQNRLIRNLSKGYRQRVGLAQALMGDPPLLILDEPTVGLDPKQIIEIREMICELGQDHTIVLSSHILPEISATCQRILIMNNGRIVASGTPESLSQRVSGAVRLLLLVKGSPGEAEKNFSSLEHVQDSRFSDGAEAGVSEVIIEAEEGTDIRESVFRLCSKANMPILQMRPLDLSLEDIFLDLTTQEDV